VVRLKISPRQAAIQIVGGRIGKMGRTRQVQSSCLSGTQWCTRCRSYTKRMFAMLAQPCYCVLGCSVPSEGSASYVSPMPCLLREGARKRMLCRREGIFDREDKKVLVSFYTINKVCYIMSGINQSSGSNLIPVFENGPDGPNALDVDCQSTNSEESCHTSSHIAPLTANHKSNSIVVND
jgi:hypothetical protein